MCGPSGTLGASLNLDLSDDSGTPTTLDVVFNNPGGANFFGPAYFGTPMHRGSAFYNGTGQNTMVQLSEIPYDAYKVIVYLTGFANNPGSQVSDGITTYYWDTPDPGDATLVETTDTDPNDGYDVATYAIFGSDEAPLTGSDYTLNFGLHLAGTGVSGGGGVGGFQLVEVTTTGPLGDYNGDGMVDAADYTVWRDNVGGDGSTLQNRDPGQTGPVDSGDYDFWKSQFGQVGAVSLASAETAAVPEPSGFALITVCLIAAAAARCTR